VWVYRSDIESSDGVAAGSLAGVQDSHGRFLGTALYSSSSQIAIRLLSREAVEDLPSLLRQRIKAAVAYREKLVSDTNAYRVVFSEADFLPGLIVDRYSDVVSLQILTQAMDGDQSRQAIVETLTEAFHPAGIVERVDPHIRELETLTPRPTALVAGEKSSTVFTMNDVQFHYDALGGQKTGSFLDQRENYAAAARYAHGEALDVFCYHGGFALHLAKTCSRVAGVDSSRPALQVADRNATLNGREIEWIEGNAFDLMKDYSAAHRQYDTIILDPPAFAKTRQHLPTAMRGYKELNLRAIKMLKPGGMLVTCSCSYHVSPSDFLENIASAAADSHRNLRILEHRTQSPDHPILLNVPETAYLKCVILEVST
jgi:23S rRNA (cytosine1962-C5)-methyltransferase